MNYSSWLESRQVGINQGVLGSSPRGGAIKKATYENDFVGGFLFATNLTLLVPVIHPYYTYTNKPSSQP